MENYSLPKAILFFIYTMERFVITNHSLTKLFKSASNLYKSILELVSANHSFYHILFIETTK